MVALKAPSPFCLPLMVERLREQLSTEKLKDRLARLLAEGEAAVANASGRVLRPGAAPDDDAPPAAGRQSNIQVNPAEGTKT